MENTPLYVTFPRIYSISNQKEAKVGEIREVCRLNWCRKPFIWKRELIDRILVLIGDLSGSKEED